MTEAELKVQIAELLQNRPAKIWLARQAGHRLDFVWSCGDAQLEKEQVLAHQGRHFLLGQGVGEDLKSEAVALFNTFVGSRAAQTHAGDEHRMRLRRG